MQSIVLHLTLAFASSSREVLKALLMSLTDIIEGGETKKKKNVTSWHNWIFCAKIVFQNTPCYK